MRRLALSVMALLTTALGATPYRPPIEEAPKARPQGWIARKAGEARWCSFASLKTFQAALDSGDFDGDDRVVVWSDRGLLTIMVSNDSEDAMTDDVYHLDAHQKIVRMVRTGHYINNPMFSVTYVPDWTGRLVMTPSSRAVVRRMDQAEYESYVTEWPKFVRFDRMPFRALIRLKPVVAVKKGCSSAAP